jgi:hypothetical protein
MTCWMVALWTPWATIGSPQYLQRVASSLTA